MSMEKENDLYEPDTDLIGKYNDAKIRVYKQYDIVELFVFYGFLPNQALYPKQALQYIFLFITACRNDHAELCNELLRKLIGELTGKDESHPYLKSFFVTSFCNSPTNKNAWVWLDYLFKVNKELALQVYSTVIGHPGFSYTVFESILEQAYDSISKTDSPENSFSAYLVKNDLQFSRYALARFAKSSRDIKEVSDNVRTGTINRDAASAFVERQKRVQQSLGHVIIKWAVEQRWISERLLNLFGISRASIKKTEELLKAIEKGLNFSEKVTNNFSPASVPQALALQLHNSSECNSDPQGYVTAHQTENDSEVINSGNSSSALNLFIREKISPDFLPKPEMHSEESDFLRKQDDRPQSPEFSDSLKDLPSTPESNNLSSLKTPESDQLNLPSTPQPNSPLRGTPVSPEQCLPDTPNTGNLPLTPVSETKSSNNGPVENSSSCGPGTPLNSKQKRKLNFHLLLQKQQNNKEIISVKNVDPSLLENVDPSQLEPLMGNAQNFFPQAKNSRCTQKYSSTSDINSENRENSAPNQIVPRPALSTSWKN